MTLFLPLLLLLLLLLPQPDPTAPSFSGSRTSAGVTTSISSPMRPSSPTFSTLDKVYHAGVGDFVVVGCCGAAVAAAVGVVVGGVAASKGVEEEAVGAC